FADHGKTSPSAVMEIADRSDLGVNGTQGPLRVKVQVSKLTKLGAAQALATGQSVGGPLMGSVNQNANFPDDGPDGYYASIPGDRLKVVKVGDGSDATGASVPLRGATTQRDATTNRPLIGSDGRAQKTLQTDAFSVAVDVPRYQADDIYETRARVPQ